jgi:hypothetical protein
LLKVVAALFSLSIDPLAKKFGIRTVYFAAHFIGGICLFIPLIQYTSASGYHPITIALLWAGAFGVVSAVLNSS